MANRSLGRLLLAALVPVVAGSACAAPEPGVARGEQLWDTCVPCHGATGEGNQALGAPAIAGLPAWYVQAQLGKFEDALRGSHPQDVVGLRMKSMARALDLEGDRESVAAYVATLPPRAARTATLAEGDATRGAAEYAARCVSCHQADAGGMEALNAPPLRGQHDWYLLAQLEKFWNGWRGADPVGDPFGGIMAGIAAQLDRATAVDIIAYLRTLP